MKAWIAHWRSRMQLRLAYDCWWFQFYSWKQVRERTIQQEAIPKEYDSWKGNVRCTSCRENHSAIRCNGSSNIPSYYRPELLLPRHHQQSTACNYALKVERVYAIAQTISSFTIQKVSMDNYKNNKLNENTTIYSWSARIEDLTPHDIDWRVL